MQGSGSQNTINTENLAAGLITRSIKLGPKSICKSQVTQHISAPLPPVVPTKAIGDSVPRHPAKIFLGRESELRSIHEFMAKKEQSICVISGMGGMGGSEIANNYVNTYRQSYTHVIWIHAGSSESVEKSFRRLYWEMKVAQYPVYPVNDDEDFDQIPIHTLVSHLYHVLQQVSEVRVKSPAPLEPTDKKKFVSNLLLIFDGPHSTLDVTSGFVEMTNSPLQPFLPGCLFPFIPSIIITSRFKGWTDISRSINPILLNKLKNDCDRQNECDFKCPQKICEQKRQFYQRIIQQMTQEESEISKESLDILEKISDGYPLAMRRATEYVQIYEEFGDLAKRIETFYQDFDKNLDDTPAKFLKNGEMNEALEKVSVHGKLTGIIQKVTDTSPEATEVLRALHKLLSSSEGGVTLSQITDELMSDGHHLMTRQIARGLGLLEKFHLVTTMKNGETPNRYQIAHRLAYLVVSDFFDQRQEPGQPSESSSCQQEPPSKRRRMSHS